MVIFMAIVCNQILNGFNNYDKYCHDLYNSYDIISDYDNDSCNSNEDDKFK